MLAASHIIPLIGRGIIDLCKVWQRPMGSAISARDSLAEGPLAGMVSQRAAQQHLLAATPEEAMLIGEAVALVEACIA